MPMQLGDVPASYADIETARRDLGFEPKATIETGLAAFVEWYRQYHGLS
jgi:UDP-glucuronate 4-epimerase